MGLTLVTAPSVEPITAAEAKTHLRVTHSSDDTYIASLIIAAREYVENYLGRALVQQTWDLKLDEWPSFPFEMPKPLLSSVTSIKYYGTDDTEYTWAATNYVVDTDSVPGRIDLAYGISRPTTALRDMNGVIIRFAAGYAPLVGDPPVVTTDYRANIPTAIKQALFLLVGHWYENREEVVTGAVVSKIPQVSEALLAPYRLWPI